MKPHVGKQICRVVSRTKSHYSSAKRGMLTSNPTNKPAKFPFIPSLHHLPTSPPVTHISTLPINIYITLLAPIHHPYTIPHFLSPIQPSATQPSIPIYNLKLFIESHTAAECSSTRNCRNRDTGSSQARCLRALRLSRWRWRGGRN